MKTYMRQALITLLIWTAWHRSLAQGSFHNTPASFGVINVIPNGQSSEAVQNSEPSLAAGLGTRSGKFVLHTFSPDSSFNLSNSYYTSVDGGIHWTNVGTINDKDTTLDWSYGGTAYATYIDASSGDILTGQASDPTSGMTFSTISGATLTGDLDQPWLRVIRPNGNLNLMDQIYFGYNDLNQSKLIHSGVSGKTATVRFSLNGGTTWTNSLVEYQTPGNGQDSPAVRLAITPDGSGVYALFQRWTSGWPGDVTGDVVLMRDNKRGLDAFQDLGSSGTVVAHDIVIPWGVTALGAQRLGSGIDVAVSPENPDDVYVAYTEVLGGVPVLQVRYSADSGLDFHPVYSITNASLPALAITTDGTVGLLFAVKVGRNLEVHFLKSGFAGFVQSGLNERVLASFPNSNPNSAYDPYLGDYFTLRAVGFDFFGAFCASGEPDPAHFPSGVYYQRNVRGADGTVMNNFSLTTAGGTLVDLANGSVSYSVDPFFFYDIAPRYSQYQPPLFIPQPIQLGDPFLHLIWAVLPQSYPQFQLQTSPVLGPLANWSLVTNGVAQTNGQFEATVSKSQSQQYFRLRQNLAGGQFETFASAGKHGSISPIGGSTNNGLQSRTFTATPSNNYAVSQWYLDGVAVPFQGSAFTISNIAADHTILATFAASNDVAVTVTALTGGDPENPFLQSSTNFYLIDVANIGLNPVTGVTLTNFLPSGVSFLSAAASQGSISNTGSLVIADLGSLANRATASVRIAMVPGLAGSITDAVTVACNQFEADLSNNTATAVIDVLAPVTITNQPVSVSTNSGSTVTFKVGVTGTPPFFYQWSFNDTGIPNATSSSLTLTNITAANAGTYSVNVSQRHGPESEYDVDSDPATLTVH